MRNIILLLGFFLVTDSGCSAHKKLSKQSDLRIIEEGYVTLVGVAQNSKEGALIESDSNNYLYYIDSLREWPDNVYRKKIRARGRCIVYDQQELMKKAPYRQGPAILRILRNAKWEIIE